MANTIREYFKAGIGLSMGFAVVSIALVFVGMLFFIPGILLLLNERKKPADKRNMSTIYGAYALMIIGCIIAGGMGAYFIFTSMLEGGDF